jgi:hypothetical protein
MFGLPGHKPLLEEHARQWMFDAFAWCLENFNAKYFFHHTELVIPSNEFFPGRVDSEQGMAELLFNNVKRYAGISHWPTRVLDQGMCAIPNSSRIEINGPLRIKDGISDSAVTEDLRITIPFNPQQINNPEGMIASFAHIISHYMGQMAKTQPPGGEEYWPHVTEILAIYLGFGLMFANSAYTFRGGCGSCYNPNATRDAYLTEQQSVYALAVFSVLKEIPSSSVTSNLKGHLRSFYKKAVKDIQQRTTDLALLKYKEPELLARHNP